MRTIGFNVEWSQELTLEQSLTEYVKTSMLIDMLKTSGWFSGYGDTVFDEAQVPSCATAEIDLTSSSNSPTPPAPPGGSRPALSTSLRCGSWS
jgi:hypothetical protein